MTSRQLRDHMKTAAGALLFAAAICAALGLEARVTGQTVGDMHIATAQPCYCSEDCP